MRKMFLNWSGGKDSAFCLYEAKQKGLPVEALVTSLNEATGRISMHGVRRELLDMQAASIGLPLRPLILPSQPGMTQYEAAISASNKMLKSEGFTTALSGDLFLEDLKAYRETLYAKDGIDTLFPLWKMDTHVLLEQFISLGFQAIIVCVNSAHLSQSFCGRLLDHSFIAELPPGVDPCGENGEYHSFVFDGPPFSKPVAFTKGETVYQEYRAPKRDDCFSTPQAAAGFYYKDLVPVV